MDKKITVCISIMILFQVIFSMDRPVPSLQTLLSSVVAKNIKEKLYAQFSDAKRVKRPLRDRLSIDVDFSKGGSISEQVQFIDTQIQQLNCGGGARDLVAKKICSRLSHIIDKAGRYVAQCYYNQLNGSTIDAIALCDMNPTVLFKVTNENIRTTIARSARYNFVLHYGYDKERCENHYRYDFYYDDDAATSIYHTYFEPRTGEKYLNHGTTVKILFFGDNDGESLAQARAYFRHTLIKIALERSTNSCMLQALRLSDTVTRVGDDGVLYQQESVAARNAGRDILLWSQESCEQAIVRKMNDFAWYSSVSKLLSLPLSWLIGDGC